MQAIEATQSICPECKRLLDAEVGEVDSKVIMRNATTSLHMVSHTGEAVAGAAGDTRLTHPDPFECFIFHG